MREQRQALIRAIEAEGIVRTSVITKELLGVPEMSDDDAAIIAAHVAEPDHDHGLAGGEHGVRDGHLFHWGTTPVERLLAPRPEPDASSG